MTQGQLSGTDLGTNSDLKNELYSLDVSAIDVCLSLFPWVKLRKTKGGVNLHVRKGLRIERQTYIRLHIR